MKVQNSIPQSSNAAFCKTTGTLNYYTFISRKAILPINYQLSHYDSVVYYTDDKRCTIPISTNNHGILKIQTIGSALSFISIVSNFQGSNDWYTGDSKSLH